MKTTVPEIWTVDRLRQMAIEELLAHGGNRDDLTRLREHFRKLDEENQPFNREIPKA